jgi:hypothetical protein
LRADNGTAPMLRQLRRDLISIEAAELTRMYGEGAIDAATRRHLQRQLDLEDAGRGDGPQASNPPALSRAGAPDRVDQPLPSFSGERQFRVPPAGRKRRLGPAAVLDGRWAAARMRSRTSGAIGAPVNSPRTSRRRWMMS